ncbi:hypothetical protein J4466_00930 [Candidatus Pacearchaeota archaeon]|nr:hypothetical protein [Candidatus Pacearchaeota archaeon]
MNYNNTDLRDIVSLALAFISVVIPTIFFIISSPDKITNQTLIIFGIIVLSIIIGSFLTYLYSRWKRMSKEIEEMQKALKVKELFNNMEIRLNVVEKLLDKLYNKRGQLNIDPRIILWILLIILLLLFLKSIGLF